MMGKGYPFKFQMYLHETEFTIQWDPTSVAIIYLRDKTVVEVSNSYQILRMSEAVSDHSTVTKYLINTMTSNCKR
jgi:hypothetical protein